MRAWKLGIAGLVVVSGTGVGLVGCLDGSDTLCEFNGNCLANVSPLQDGGDAGDGTIGQDGPIGDDGGTDGNILDADAGQDVFVPPDAGPCTVTSDPYSGCFATDDSGIFVSPSGGDAGTANGTKAKPFRYINDAIGMLSAGADPGKPGRIYVCKGEYPETVSLGATLTENVTIFGSLDCTTWSYNSTARVHVLSPVNASALSVKSATKVIEIHDVAFESPSATGTDGATGAGNSSVAALVNGATDVTFVRDSFTAGNGVPGKAGVTGTSNHTADPQTGGAASGITAGSAKTCTCAASADSSKGAQGGTGDPNSAGSGLGGSSTPATSLEPGKPGNNGFGGQGFVLGTQTCAPGHVGANGTGAANALGAAIYGTLSPTGWLPAPGNSASRGNPGQGGGGGGGDNSTGGGGGGCGGCGGAGGTAGAGGGASIALMLISSTVKLFATDQKQRSTLSAANGGQGGRGGDGEAGQAGGTGGLGGCKGGDGANGGGGSGGGGGGGGPSFGIAFLTTAPKIDGVAAIPADTLPIVVTGTPGPLGSGGSLGAATTTNGNAGIPGVVGGQGTVGVAKAVIGF